MLLSDKAEAAAATLETNAKNTKVAETLCKLDTLCIDALVLFSLSILLIFHKASNGYGYIIGLSADIFRARIL